VLRKDKVTHCDARQ